MTFIWDMLSLSEGTTTDAGCSLCSDASNAVAYHVVERAKPEEKGLKLTSQCMTSVGKKRVMTTKTRLQK